MLLCMWLLCKVIQCLVGSSLLGDDTLTTYTMLQLCCHPKMLKDPFIFYDLITVLYQTAYYQKIVLFQTIRILIKSCWFASTFVVLWYVLFLLLLLYLSSLFLWEPAAVKYKTNLSVQMAETPKGASSTVKAKDKNSLLGIYHLF